MEPNKENTNNEFDASAFNFEDDSENIEFDDDIDINAIQNQLKEHMSKTENIEYSPEQSSSSQMEQTGSDKSNDADNFILNMPTFTSGDAENKTLEPAEKSTPLQQISTKKQEKLTLQDGERKYVIYIAPDNIDFIENLDIKERKNLINKILREQDDLSKKRREIRERAKFTKQILIMVLTVIFALPIFFVLLNKSIEITILNYQQAQQNFVKLYKEQGKIKSYKTFQNHFK